MGRFLCAATAVLLLISSFPPALAQTPDLEAEAERSVEIIREAYKKAQPLPRAGLPEDIAHAALFLASDESSFINGHDLVVDGGVIGGRNWSQQQEGLKAMQGNLRGGAKA